MQKSDCFSFTKEKKTIEQLELESYAADPCAGSNRPHFLLCYLALLFRNTIFLFIPGCSPPKIARLKVEYFDMNTWVKRTALLEETPNLVKMYTLESIDLKVGE